jgi:hypothetical protein
LNSLPKTLDETYERILLNIDEEYSEAAFKVLQWIAFSARSMTVGEVAEMLAINLDDDPRFIPDQRLLDAQDVFTICSSLVTISDSNILSDKARSRDPDNHSAVIREAGKLQLAHFSVKEYLISDRIRLRAAARYGFNIISANTFISRACLVYLLQFDTIDSIDFDKISHFPLAPYAAEHWMLHVKWAGDATPDVLRQLIMALFQPQSVQYSNWTRLHKKFRPLFTSPELSGSLSPLYYASLAGLRDAVQWLLDEGADPNMQEGQYGNALHAASVNGHAAVVQVLLNNGAYVNVEGKSYKTALEAASASGHSVVVQMLLDRGADINARRYSSILGRPSGGGHAVVVKILLERIIGTSIEWGRYGDILLESVYAASSSGHTAVLQVLLGEEPDSNMQGLDRKYGIILREALNIAASKGHTAAVELLLDKGADVSTNALEAALSRGHKAVMQVLLDRVVDINTPGRINTIAPLVTISEGRYYMPLLDCL